jgi:DNA-binding NarL/FixJ family response regulator
LVAQGLRNKELAQRLSITEGTVKIHLHNIYDKLGVDGRLELVLSAQQKGLV